MVHLPESITVFTKQHHYVYVNSGSASVGSSVMLIMEDDFQRLFITCKCIGPVV